MQRVVAYRLERNDLKNDSDRVTAVDGLEDVIRRWLTSKGSVDASQLTGTFRSQSHGSPPGRFRWDRAVSDSRSWSAIELEEELPGSRLFTTMVSITNTGAAVIVYATLSSGAAFSTVSPSDLVDPQCPRVVRDILKVSSEWRHGETRITGLTPVSGAEDGRVLARSIMSPTRTLPIIVVTDDDGELVLERLDANIARDAVGLANVYRVDQNAAWALTQTLGSTWACYYGAVRLYWPRFQRDDNFRQHPRWTPDDILLLAERGETAHGLRTLLRRLVFRAAAVNVLRPGEIDLIRAAHSLAGVQAAREQSDLDTIVDSYAEDSKRLERRVAELQEEVSVLKTRLANAEALATLGAADPPEVAAATELGIRESSGPAPGEFRFYKKTGSTAKRDKMIKVADCGHGNWEGAAKGDKAKKGIAALEQRNNWKTVWHCASCTGGGLWKVKW